MTVLAERPTVDVPVRHPRRALAFAAILAATVMDLLDGTVVQVAAPAIREGIGGSLASLQWMTAAYTLALAVTLLVGGRLGDMYGRTRVLLAGIAGFTVASLACALAWSPEALIASRTLQGVFGAVMLPQTFGLIRELFPGEEMKKAWGVFGPVMGLSAVLGPVVAGVLVDADLFGTGWRMIFLVNLPIGAFALVAAWRGLPRVAPTAQGTRLDLTGVLLAGTGMFLLVFPLVQGRELGWPMWTVAMAVAAVPVLGAFALHQLRRKRSGRTPLVEPSVFRTRSYTAGVVVAIAFTAGMGGMALTMSLFMQLGLGFSPVRAGLTSFTWALGAVAGTIVSGALAARLGRRLVHIGLAVMALGLVVMYVAFDANGTAMSSADFILPNLVGGAGMGMVFTPLFDLVLGRVRDHEVGSATGILQSVQQLGMSLGVAVLGTVFFDLLVTGPAPEAAKTTALATVGLLALAFVLGFALPHKARDAAAS